MGEMHNHLKPIIIQRKRFQHAEQSVYRVYSGPGEFQLVEAATAHEAFERSDINRPYKIERETLIRQPSLDPKLLINSEEGDEVSFDPRLPDPEDLKPILTAILGEALHDAAIAPFEEISITDLKKHVAQAIVEPVIEEPQVAIAAEMSAPLKPAEPEVESLPEEALTPDQVDALLRGDSA